MYAIRDSAGVGSAVPVPLESEGGGRGRKGGGSSPARLVENMEAARTKPTTPDATLPDPYDPEMTVVEIDGYGYVGVLTIPALELELPVMSEWDAARLKIAPAGTPAPPRPETW